MAEWSKERPTKPGWYWCFNGYMRIVHISEYKWGLYTNEDGGAPLKDEEYNTCQWHPITNIPQPPKE